MQTSFAGAKTALLISWYNDGRRVCSYAQTCNRKINFKNQNLQPDLVSVERLGPLVSFGASASLLPHKYWRPKNNAGWFDNPKSVRNIQEISWGNRLWALLWFVQLDEQSRAQVSLLSLAVYSPTPYHTQDIRWMRNIWRPKHSRWKPTPSAITGVKSIPLLRANGANESLSLDRPFFSARGKRLDSMFA